MPIISSNKQISKNRKEAKKKQKQLLEQKKQKIIQEANTLLNNENQTNNLINELETELDNLKTELDNLKTEYKKNSNPISVFLFNSKSKKSKSIIKQITNTENELNNIKKNISKISDNYTKTRKNRTSKHVQFTENITINFDKDDAPSALIKTKKTLSGGKSRKKRRHRKLRTSIKRKY